MRKSLFKKARTMLSDGRFIAESETPTGYHFKIVPSKYKPTDELLPEEYYEVSIFYKDYILKTSCTCEHMSKSSPDNLCAHKIAALSWLVGAQ